LRVIRRLGHWPRVHARDNVIINWFNTSGGKPRTTATFVGPDLDPLDGIAVE
jgi:hypothetical protein